MQKCKNAKMQKKVGKTFFFCLIINEIKKNIQKKDLKKNTQLELKQ